MKKTFVSAAQLEQIAAQYPTPFHIYDEQGIRENARRLNAAFSWNPGFREYFAVKATPTPAIMKVLQEEGCGCDCSSLTELMMAERIGCVGEHIVFSSNETPAEDYRLAAKLGAVINLDDLTHVDFLERAIGYIPKKIGCRFNPGGTFSLGETREGFQVMDNPGDAKYGMTHAQIAEAFRLLKAKGAEEFGIHAFLASNTLSNEYYPALARMLFRLAAELQEQNIWVEMVHGDYAMLMTGLGNERRDYEKLLEALQYISGKYGITENETGRSEDVLAFNLEQGPIPSIKERIPLAEAAGRRLYDSLIPYPPGIPLACPGEILTKEAVQYLQERVRRNETVIGVDENGYVCVASEV